jgi:hypothetical protein
MGVMLSAGGAFAWYRDVMAKELKGRKDANLVLKELETRRLVARQGRRE